jgi:4-amino-4-deoxy-L-arabinose transferase-like glycosyltransferase
MEGGLLGRGWRAPSARTLVIAGLAIALAIRLGAIAATHHYTPVSDPLSYDTHAHSIAGGHGYPKSIYAPGGGPSALRPPGYPYALGAVYWLTGKGFTAGRVAGALAGTLTVGLIALLAFQLFGRTAAFVALGVAAVYPPLWLLSDTLLSENLFLPLMLGAVCLLLEHRRRPRGLRWPIVIGVLLGLVILTRTNGFVLWLPIGLGLLAARGTPRRWLAPAAMIAVSVLTVLPWTIRNAIELHAFVPVSTQDAYLLAGTYNDQAKNDPVHWSYRPANLVPEYAALLSDKSLKEADVERKLRSKALSYIAHHPLSVPQVGFWNLLRTLNLSSWHYSKLVYHDDALPIRGGEVAIVSFFLLALLSIGGGLTRAARAAPRFIWGCPLAILVSIIFVSGTSRYRLPMEPFFVLLGSVALCALQERWAARRGAVRAAA